MTELDDMELVRRYAESTSEEAFAALVQRYLELVHASALRRVRDPHLAEEITQSVFLLLARKARSLGRGTILAAWLYRATRFVASDAQRAAHRRREREKRAMEQISESEEPPVWEHLEPLLEEALDWLKERDRQVLLLRFFRRRSFRELALDLGVTEDAAQKRVTRAVARLRDFYVRRGASVSVSALTAMLGAHVVQAAPAGLASAILGSAGAMTGAVGAFGLWTSTMKLILTTKTKAIGVSLALTALSVVTLTEHNQAQRLREENGVLLERMGGLEATLAARSAAFERVAITDEELEMLRRQAAEVHLLRAEIAALLRQDRQPTSSAAGQSGQENAKTALSPSETDGLDPMERMRLARAILAEARPAEALSHYLHCFDEGMKQSPGFAGVRLSFLLDEIAELGETYPPAKEALRSRRDRLEAGLSSGTVDATGIHELTALNEKLREPDRNLAVAERLDLDSPARAGVFRSVAEQLIAQQRYAELVQVAVPEQVFARQRRQLESVRTVMEGRPNSAMAAEALLRSLTTVGAQGVEALAGMGYTDRARALAGEVLELDVSPGMREALIERARRAGNQELVLALDGG